MAGMTLLSSTLSAAAGALLLVTGLETRAITVRGVGGVPGATGLLFLQLGKMGGQGLQLSGEVLKQRSNAGRCRLPVAIGNLGRWKGRLGLSLPEIQAVSACLSSLISH